MPNRSFFKKKIAALNDDGLIRLSKISGDSKNPIVVLVQEELQNRSLIIPKISSDPGSLQPQKSGDGNIVNQWNWGAFILAPLWTLANGLNGWALFTMLPIINIPVTFYLGFRGNRIASEKSSITSYEDFMIVQMLWSKWALRFIGLGWHLRFSGIFLENFFFKSRKSVFVGSLLYGEHQSNDSALGQLFSCSGILVCSDLWCHCAAEQ